MHPASLRCSSLAYDEYASLLAPCDAGASPLAPPGILEAAASLLEEV